MTIMPYLNTPGSNQPMISLKDDTQDWEMLDRPAVLVSDLLREEGPHTAHADGYASEYAYLFQEEDAMSFWLRSAGVRGHIGTAEEAMRRLQEAVYRTSNAIRDGLLEAIEEGSEIVARVELDGSLTVIEDGTLEPDEAGSIRNGVDGPIVAHIVMVRDDPDFFDWPQAIEANFTHWSDPIGDIRAMMEALRGPPEEPIFFEYRFPSITDIEAMMETPLREQPE